MRKDIGRCTYSGVFRSISLHPPLRGGVLLQCCCCFGPCCSAAAQGSVRIGALGASNSYGKGVPRAQAYPAVLQGLLEQRGVSAVVAHAGTNGDATGGMLTSRPPARRRHRSSCRWRQPPTRGATVLQSSTFLERQCPAADNVVLFSWAYTRREATSRSAAYEPGTRSETCTSR